MAKDEKEPVVDPVIAAALVDDPDDDEEDKKRKAELLESEETDEADDDEPADKQEDQSEEEDKSEDKPEAKSEDKTEDKAEDKSEDKPEEPKDTQIQQEDPRQPEEDKTRKEKRAERKQKFIESIRKDTNQEAEARKRLLETEPYSPIDYSEQEEFKTDELKEDRQKFGDYQFSQGAKIERFYAEQEKFWDNVDHDNQILGYDPKYSFLAEGSPEFDENLAGDINELYLEVVGYNDQNKTVRRTDLPYASFVKRYVERMDEWAEERSKESAQQITQQKSKQGIRPSGGSRKGLGQLRPGMISSMSDEEFDKHEAEIDSQILDML